MTAYLKDLFGTRKAGTSSLAFLVGLILFNSCIYYPPEELTNVEPKTIPPVVINQTLDLNKDTILIWTSARLNFNLTSDGVPVVQVMLKFRDQNIYFDSPSGFIDINAEPIPDGTYKLSMEIQTATGSGSLAEHVGLETFKMLKEWVVIIDRPYNHKIEFTHTTIEDGFLTIHWEKINTAYFYGYELQVVDSALSYFYTRIFTDPDITSLTDSSFVGGKVEFRLKLIFYDDAGILNKSNEATYAYRYPIDFSIESNHDTLTFRWKSIPFRHTIQIRSFYSNAVMEPVNDTIYKMASPGFSGPITYEFSVDPVIDMPYDWQMYSLFRTYPIGTKTEKEYSGILYYPQYKKYYMKMAMFIRKHNGTNFTLQGSYIYSCDDHAKTSIALSPDRSHVYTSEFHFLC